MFDDRQSVSRTARPSWLKVAGGGCAALVVIGGIVVTILYTAAIVGDSRVVKPRPSATASARAPAPPTSVRAPTPPAKR